MCQVQGEVEMKAHQQWLNVHCALDAVLESDPKVASSLWFSTRSDSVPQGALSKFFKTVLIIMMGGENVATDI
jgi:hypothetical protein